MFEHYVFGISSSQPPDAQDIPPSPTDTTHFTPHPCSDYFSLLPKEQGLNDVIDKFSTQSLCAPYDGKFRGWDPVEAPSLDIDPTSDNDSEMDLFCTPSIYSYHEQYQESPISGESTRALDRIRERMVDRRKMRQYHTKLQSEGRHVRDISRLVEKMVGEEEQCRIISRSSTSPTSSISTPSSHPNTTMRSGLTVDTHIPIAASPIPSPNPSPIAADPNLDEGFCDDEDMSPISPAELLGLRRAGTLAGIRKYSSTTTTTNSPLSCIAGFGFEGVYQRSRDMVYGGGRAKVRCPPRMRKRRKVACVGS